ncbi:MAG: MgtC/SapB family protein [Rhodospirillales bacterium]|nr:MgtC/SapB family protein [Rhodospirillales bacterium]
MVSSPWFGLAASLGIGLLIGLERERSKGVGAGRRAAGIRTFTLASLLGAVAMHLGGELFLALVTTGVALLAALSYARDHGDDPGLTTEIGLIVTPLLGGLAMRDISLAAALGTAIAVIFAVKSPLHSFVTRSLTSAEMRDGLVFAVATLIIWPQLPDRYLGPFQALNPHSIWFLVILIMAIGACGHIATRALGARFGLPIAGLASGFVSSTATIGSMAGQAAKAPASMRAAVAGASFSTLATFIQLAILLAALSYPTLLLMAPSLAVGAAVAALYGLGFALRATTPEGITTPEPGRAFSPGSTLGVAAMVAVMLVVSAALRHWLGESGITAGSIVAGFADAHAPAISIAALVNSGKMPPQDAVVPILAAVTSNSVAKIAMSVGAGSRAFVLRITPGIVGSMAAAWAILIPALLR